MNFFVFLGQAKDDAKKFGWEFSSEGKLLAALKILQSTDQHLT